MIKRRNIFTRLRHLIVAMAAVALPSPLRTAEAKETGAMDRKAMSDLFDKHVNAELAGDLDTTMATMSDDPWLNHVRPAPAASAATACGPSIAITWSASSSRPT